MSVSFVRDVRASFRGFMGAHCLPRIFNGSGLRVWGERYKGFFLRV